MPRTVVLTAESLEKVIHFLGQYSNPLTHKNKCVEAFGFLFCRQTPAYYIIEDAVGVATGERAAVELKPEELAVIEFLSDQRPDLFLGGWFHSHPGWGLFFSGTDEQNQLFYQQMNEDGLGIVWDYTLAGKKGKGFGFAAFRLKDPSGRPGFAPVPLKLLGVTAALMERIFAPLGYDKKVLAAAWRDLEEAEMRLKPFEESLVRTQAMSGDISTLIGAGRPADSVLRVSDHAVEAEESNLGEGKARTAAPPATAQNPASQVPVDELDPETARAKATSLKEMGILHFGQSHYAQAARELQAAITLHRADTEAWAFYYLCLFNEGDRIAANNVFRELGEVLGKDTSKWLAVARLCEERDNFEGAQHAYTQVIKYDPLNFALLDKIKELGQKKQAQDARKGSLV